MRIAVDARAAAEVPAGRGRYVRELIRAFAALPDDHEFVLLARRPWEGAQLDARFRWRTIGLPDPAWSLAAAATRGELDERYPRAVARAHVVPHGVEERFFVDRAEEPYVLMTGTLEPRKNIVRALDAAARLPAELRERFELR